jgi:hypothetical protein
MDLRILLELETNPSDDLRITLNHQINVKLDQKELKKYILIRKKLI